MVGVSRRTRRPTAGDFLDDPVEETAALLDTNIGGVLHASRAALAHFVDQGWGTLVNVASPTEPFAMHRAERDET